MEPLGAVVHSGVHVFGVPEQPVTPAASKAYSLPSLDPTYTTPFTTTGDELMPPPVDAVHSARHVLGLPEQPMTPAASKAYSLPSFDPTYTTPLATVGDDVMMTPLVVAVHSGVHVVGVPAQPVTPAASKAYSLSSPAP